jgi:hypothetical protein
MRTTAKGVEAIMGDTMLLEAGVKRLRPVLIFALFVVSYGFMATVLEGIHVIGERGSDGDFLYQGMAFGAFMWFCSVRMGRRLRLVSGPQAPRTPEIDPALVSLAAAAPLLYQFSAVDAVWLVAVLVGVFMAIKHAIEEPQ